MPTTRQQRLDHITEYYKSFSNNELDKLCENFKISKKDHTHILPTNIKLLVLSKLHNIKQMKDFCSVNKEWAKCFKSNMFWGTLLLKKYPKLSMEIINNMTFQSKKIQPYYLYFFCS